MPEFEMPGFDKTVTVFNKSISTSPMVTVWHKTVLHGCFYGSRATTKGNNGIKQLDYATICKIPKSDAYVSPTEFRISPDVGKFTLQPGDLIVLGEVSENITGAEPCRENDIRKLYEGSCFIVKSVSDRAWADVLPHYIASEV